MPIHSAVVCVLTDRSSKIDRAGKYNGLKNIITHYFNNNTRGQPKLEEEDSFGRGRRTRDNRQPGCTLPRCILYRMVNNGYTFITVSTVRAEEIPNNNN